VLTDQPSGMFFDRIFLPRTTDYLHMIYGERMELLL